MEGINCILRLKVGDLGLGRIFSSETIEAYSKVGTPLYMSPEVDLFFTEKILVIKYSCFMVRAMT